MGSLCEVRIEQLTPRQRELAEAIGLDGFIRLVEEFGGDTIYIPSVVAVTKQLRYQQILADVKSEDPKKLADRYGVSLKTVYNIINAQKRIQDGGD